MARAAYEARLAQMSPLTAIQIQQRAADSVFGRPLIMNSFRGVIAEAIVACALEPTWRWCAADWASWDFEHPDGTRLEVKQSAARQSWTSQVQVRSTPKFDIQARTGHWEGGITWQPNLTGARLAHLYVFAFHPVTGDEADHRDPTQWQFYVVDSKRLAANKSISLPRLKALADPISIAALPGAVETARSGQRSVRTK